MEICKDSVIKKMDDIMATGIDEDMVLLSINKGKYYGFDDIAAAIWSLMEMPITINQMVGKLMEVYQVSEKECEDDVIFFIQKLYEQELIEIK